MISKGQFYLDEYEGAALCSSVPFHLCLTLEDV